MSRPGPAPDGGQDQKEPFRRGQAVWWFCASVATAAGLLCASAVWGWTMPVAVGATVAIVAGCAATPLWMEEGIGAVAKIARFAVQAGLVVPAAAGLVAALGLAGVLVVAMIAVTTPGLRDLVPARWRPARHVPTKRSPSPVSMSPPAAPSAPREESPVVVEEVETSDVLATLTDDELCLAWRRSFVRLNAARSAPERMRVVEQRQRYLDELQRRCPDGLESWLGSGARAPSNPLPYLRAHPRQAG